MSGPLAHSSALEHIDSVRASPLIHNPVQVFAKLGASLGSPVPFGNIPDGASGSPILGVVAGGSVVIPISSNWGVQTELQFVHYGASFDTPLKDQPYVDKVPITTPDGSVVVFDVETTFTGKATGKFSNSYFQAPVMVVYNAGGPWNYTGGVYVGWLTSTQSYARGKGQVGIRPEEVEKDMYFSNNISAFDYGLMLGLQYRITRKMVVDMRGALGLTSVFDPDFKTISYTVRNTFLQITFNYGIL